MGNRAGEALVAIVPPSQYWTGEAVGNSTVTMEGGGQQKVTFRVTVPPDQGRFDSISEELRFEDGRPGVYSKRTGEQFVTAVAAPTETLEDIYQKVQDGGAAPKGMDIRSLSDPRMGVAPTLLVLRTREKVISYDPLETIDVPLRGSNLTFTVKDAFIRTIKVKQNAYMERSVTVRNVGGTEEVARISYFTSPLQYTPFYMEHMDVPTRRIAPGQAVEFKMVLNTETFPFNKAVNALVLVDDGVTPSNVTMLELEFFTREKSENEKLGRQYYDMIWGGGIRYERYLWLVLFMAISGAALISDDLKNNSIALYLSRPISWAEYIAGKSAGLLIALMPISVLPAIILYITGIAFSNRDLGEALDTLWLLGAIALSYLITLVLMVSISVALSSVSKKWIYAGVGTFSVFIFSSIISTILRAIFDQDWLKLIDIRTLMKLLFRPLFALPYDASDIGFEWYVAALALVLIIGLCFATVIFRFQNREVAR
jgi:ABC-type transport system involved in multi-copper enzyme maturation permease subunit